MIEKKYFTHKKYRTEARGVLVGKFDKNVIEFDYRNALNQNVER